MYNVPSFESILVCASSSAAESFGFPLASSRVFIRARIPNQSNIPEHISAAIAVSKLIATSDMRCTFISLCHTRTGSARRTKLYSPPVIARDVVTLMYRFILMRRVQESNIKPYLDANVPIHGVIKESFVRVVRRTTSIRICRGRCGIPDMWKGFSRFDLKAG